MMAARQRSAGSQDWLMESATGTVTLKAFPGIGAEKYRLYQEVSG
jgi:hypothetical protein